MSIFQKTVINKYLKNLDSDKVIFAFERFKKFYGDKERLQNILQLKEENYQEGFLREVFVETLGYTLNPDKNYDLTTELKNKKNNRKADGAILKNGDAIAVIELKSTKTKDLESIKEQAFDYKINQPNCKYIITSNFQSIRFYIDNATEYEEFNLFKISEEEFKLLYLLLSKDSIFNNIPEKIKQETRFHEQQISEKLYKNYQDFKNNLFEFLVSYNQQYDRLTLYKKSQKLLDRFLFILFAEDCGLIPPNAINKIIDDYDSLKKLKIKISLYERFVLFFKHLDKGEIYEGWGEIHAYNGGLFRYDDILDSPTLKLPDGFLKNHLIILSTYDFNSDVDVNILGQIFEHSLSEIEEITADLQGKSFDKTKSKRKKDGIFYTPKYITKYIVDNTLGVLCKNKKEQLDINIILIEDEYRTENGKITTKGNVVIEKLTEYKSWLLNLKVLDPACGSGAFLNQTLDFLMHEHKNIDNLMAEITGEQIRIFDTDKYILERNIYGVDINEESVEIAKLSLWLRTARCGRPLSDLSSNIKCGNSLISSFEIASEKAFDWDSEFKEIMQNGGFDVVLGNPPWGARFSQNEIDYLDKLYPSISKTRDSYLYFMLLSLSKLNVNGLFSFIVPNTWLLINSAKDFRIHLLKQNIVEISDFGDSVFSDATVESMIITMTLGHNVNNSVITKRFKDNKLVFSDVSSPMIWNYDEYCRINIELTNDIFVFIQKLNKQSSLFKDVAEIIWGIKPYQVGYGSPIQTVEMQDKRIYHSDIKIDDSWKPLLVGSNVNRYSLDSYGIQYIKYGNNLMYPSNEQKMINDKILIRQTSDIIRACFDDKSYYAQNSLFIITSDKVNLKILTVLLNSKLLNFVYSIYNPQQGKVFAEIKPSVIKILPISSKWHEVEDILVNKSNFMHSLNSQSIRERENFILTLKENKHFSKITKAMYNFNDIDFEEFKKELAKQKVKFILGEETKEWRQYFNTTKQKINEINELIKQTNIEIDKIIYSLYSLTDKEIEIIENALK